MELRKAYVDVERKTAEREIKKEDRKLEHGEITQKQYQQSVQSIRRQLEEKILQLI